MKGKNMTEEVFFDEKPGPLVRAVIDGYEFKEGQDHMLVRCRLESFVVEIGIKAQVRGEYTQDAPKLRQEISFPGGFDFSVPVYNAEAEIRSAGGDLGIVGVVTRAIASQLAMDTNSVLVRHVDHIVVEEEKRNQKRGGMKKTSQKGEVL